MTPTGTIRLDLQDGLATLTLIQAARGNPIDGDFGRDFRQVASDLLDLPGLRAVLLRAEGANFGVGGDLKTFHPVRDRLGPLVRQWTADFHMGLQRFWRMPVPIVAAVHGYVMGGSAALVAGCDVVVAGNSARIGSAFSKIGFTCDSGSTIGFTYRMGVARARRFVLLGELLSSEEALQAGLFDRIAPDAQLQDDALALARQLAAGPTLAYGEIKRLFMFAGAAQLEAQLEDEALTLSRIATTADAHEGIAAQLERRPPAFKGR